MDKDSVSISLIILAISTLFCTIGVAAAGYWAYKQGVEEGLDKYHKACYHIGGVAVRKGTAVACAPLGPMPEEKDS